MLVTINTDAWFQQMALTPHPTSKLPRETSRLTEILKATGRYPLATRQVRLDFITETVVLANVSVKPILLSSGLTSRIT